MNRHSRLLGNAPHSLHDQCLRGQRAFCSNRGNRRGCGRTFAFFLGDVLPRHTLSASLVWQWLLKMLAGSSLKAAAETLRLPFALETFYRLRRKCRQRLDSLRTRLCREQPPPPCARSDPWLQTAEHLQAVFPRVACPPAAFQLHFQRPFLG